MLYQITPVAHTSSVRSGAAFLVPRFSMSRAGGLNHDVRSNGRRLVVTEPLAEDTKCVSHAVQNWFTEFKDRQPD